MWYYYRDRREKVTLKNDEKYKKPNKNVLKRNPNIL